MALHLDRIDHGRDLLFELPGARSVRENMIIQEAEPT